MALSNPKIEITSYGSSDHNLIDPFSSLAAEQSVIVNNETNYLEGCCKCFGCCCADFNNTYDLYLANSKDFSFQFKESSNFCCRSLCNPNHALTLTIRAKDGTIDILSIDKPFKCCCCPAISSCCQKEITIKRLPESNVIGYVQEPCCGGWFTPSLIVFDKPGGTYFTRSA